MVIRIGLTFISTVLIIHRMLRVSGAKEKWSMVKDMNEERMVVKFSSGLKRL